METVAQSIRLKLQQFPVRAPNELESAFNGMVQRHLQAVGISTQVFAFLDLPEEAMDAPGARALAGFAESIEFDGASFAYDGGPLILKGVDLRVPAGAVVVSADGAEHP